MTTRADVIQQGRSYLKTPFQHQARVQGLGLDCVGIVLCVGDDLGLADVHGRPFKRHQYPKYELTSIGGFVLAECKRRLIEKPVTSLAAGDLVVMKVPDVPCHAGIVTSINGALYLLHAYNAPGVMKVIEHVLDKAWRRRIVAAFQFPGVE